ncbi:hypothetical protein TAGGR_1702 [Thermodesulfovibrio aggregans]|uniref:Uncharacterized protein n=2 Tax=Thermodesulfovibrio aggregans TaxID=86166 RepID=A0A0U9I9E3_9BACT|nr:hypothetical protein TAGGR_1702 [Thermodesulfovibrio aggregans]
MLGLLIKMECPSKNIIFNMKPKVPKKPVSTVHQQRLPLFCKKTKFETIFGNIELSKELSQTHKDILDAMATCSIKKGKTLEGRMFIVFDIREVLKFLGHKKITHHKWLSQKLDDMMSTIIKLQYTKNDRIYKIHSNIINKFGYSEKFKKENIKEGTFGEGCYYVVVFSEEFTKLYEHDTVIYLDKQTIKAIVDVSSDFVKSVIRFCMSHQQCNMKLEDIMYYLGYENISERHKQRLKAEILKYKNYLEENFNIIVKQEKNQITIFYKSNLSVFLPE